MTERLEGLQYDESVVKKRADKLQQKQQALKKKYEMEIEA